MHKDKPKISVIMSVFNSEKYLKEAIDSILNQTFTDFEFIIADDCSTDSSLKILEEYLEKDNRIILLKKSENSGLTKNLNLMLGIAKGDYIARMDADDISLPDRLKTQYELMENNKEIDICGTYVKKFDKTNIYKNKILPVKNSEIKVALLFENILMHPTIMFRTKTIRNLSIKYNEDFRIMQDYELWTRTIDKIHFRNINKVLLLQRISPDSVTSLSNQKLKNRVEYYEKVMKTMFDKLKISTENNNLNKMLFFNLGSNTLKNNEPLQPFPNYYKSYIKCILKEQLVQERDTSLDIIGDYIFKFYSKNTSYGIKTYLSYLKNKINTKNIRKIDKIKFLIKCIIRY